MRYTKPLATEAQVQAAVVDFLRVTKRNWIILHIPNSPFIRARGVIAGTPDLLVVAPAGRLAFIEVKGPKGRLRPEQEVFRDRCQNMGVPWFCVRSVDEVEAVVVPHLTKLWKGDAL